MFRAFPLQAAWKIPVHLIACISHGRKTYGYTFFENIKHGNNLTIEVLFRVLLDTIKTEGRLPPTLFLQLDNTSKQCKGQYVMGFVGLLVEHGVFERAVVSFLPVGHTHEDIDQIFSRLAIYLRKNDARNQWELLQGLQAAYTPSFGHEIATDHMETVANISDWLKDGKFLTPMGAGQGIAGGSDGIFSYRQFQFTKKDGKTVMQVRKNTGTNPADEKFEGLHPYKPFHEVFRKTPPQMWDAKVPDAQRRDAPEASTQQALKKGNDAMVASRLIPEDVNRPLLRMLELLVSTDPLPFHWVSFLSLAVSSCPVPAVCFDLFYPKRVFICTGHRGHEDGVRSSSGGSRGGPGGRRAAPP